MTMITNIEKVNTFNFNDAVNTSYNPASASQVGTNDTKNFTDEFEKVAADDRMDFEIKKRGEQNIINPLENRESKKDNRTNAERDRKTGERIDRENPGGQKEKIEEKGPRQNRKDEKPGENEKTGSNSKNKNEKTGTNSKNENEKTGTNSKNENEKTGTNSKNEYGKTGTNSKNENEKTGTNSMNKYEKTGTNSMNKYEKTGTNSKNKNEKTDSIGKNNNEKIENSQEYPEEKKITDKHTRLGKDVRYNTRTIKEVIKKSQLQQAEMIKIKEEIKENFSESKKINSTDHVEKMMVKDRVTGSGSEEKGIKNKLVDNFNSRLDKTGEVKLSDEKIGKELNVEKKQVQEPDANKNDGKSFFPNELKLQKNNSSQEKQPNFNLLNDVSRNIQQLNSIKVKQVFSQHNVFDQYRLFNEKIANSVENSIKFLISSGESRATIQLHPPELGRVQVELVVQDNQVTAKINTENAAVKEVILTNLDQLKSNLTNAGTQINKFDVEVGGFKNHFERQSSKEGSANGRHQGGTGHGPPQDSNELMPDQVKNQQALTFYLGRSINCLI